MVLDGKRHREISGAAAWTTISEMELLAAIHALRGLPQGTRVDLHSDSECLIRGMRYLARQWQKQGWKNRRGGSVQHRQHWEELMSLDHSLRIRWRWIRGHDGHPMQSKADRLAYQAARDQWTALRRAA